MKLSKIDAQIIETPFECLSVSNISEIEMLELDKIDSVDALSVDHDDVEAVSVSQFSELVAADDNFNED